MPIPFENRNFQKELDARIARLQAEGKVPNLLLHACCAPCSSYCIEYLSQYFHITVFYYNPNITSHAEYQKRIEEEKRFIREFPAKYPVSLIEGAYEPERFEQMAKGLEDAPEGGARCMKCYRLRLEETAKLAKKLGSDCFTTTLSISPLKKSSALNAIGQELEKQYGVPYLYSDFKKKNGYRRSVELSHEYGLYRQNYCGCRFSLRDGKS
ncbi:MAG: epoxyqueuosine reductase QueH [Lachnospiraceae bacterium]|jgi:predicted adenine nucleotide alpha hydrolase (AANH) superfamily ATPase